MKIAKLLFFLSPVFICANASAQFSISKVKPSNIERKGYVDTLIMLPKTGTLTNEFFDKEFWKAERRRIRKERNTTTFRVTLDLTQAQFENWAAGGSNTFTGRSTIFFNHLYKREKYSVNTVADMRYGMNYIDGKKFKNEDYFRVAGTMNWSIHKNWSYTAGATLISQFSPSYKSRDDTTRVSSFMSPGTLDLAVGWTYTYKTFSAQISAATGRGTFVLDRKLRYLGMNGVPVGQASHWQLGPQLIINYSKNFAKDKIQLRTRFDAFTNIKKAPTVRWETWIDIPATKFLTTKLWGLALYNKEAITPRPDAVQYNYSIGLSLAYTFTNK